MPSTGEIRAQVERETERRNRLAVPTFAGGVLFLLGTIISEASITGRPTVGIVQGLAPALKGEAQPAVSPRAAEVKYISHHAFGLLAGTALTAIGIAALILAILLLIDAARFRRPESWKAAGMLVLIGGGGYAVASLAHEVVLAIRTHEFAVGHVFTNHAVEQTLTNGAGNIVTEVIAFLCWIGLCAGAFAALINAMRVGLVPRWVSFLGILTVLLIVLPLLGSIARGVIPAFWMVAIGMLFAERFPGGMPEAWAAGVARPWPTGAERRARAQGAAAARGKGAPVTAAAGAAAEVVAGSDDAPAPAPRASSGKRRKKRGGRR